MNEQEINQIKEGIRELIRMISERNEPLSEEMKVYLAQVLEYSATRIRQLREEQQNSQEPQVYQEPPNLPPEQNLIPGPFESSQVNSYRYDPNSKDLMIKFHGKDTADSGPTYQYSGVPEFIFKQFIAGKVPPMTSGENQYHRWIKGVTPSLGASLNRLIKSTGIPYQRVA